MTEKNLTMKKIFLGLSALVLLATACKKEAELPPADRALNAATTAAYTDTVTLSGVLSTSRTLSASILYRLNGKYYVKSGARLIIPAGTRIEGIKKTDPRQASALVICKGGRIDALGTAANPITFSSAQPTKAAGDWGGVVILGRARINQPNNPIIEGIDQPSLPTGVDVHYGTYGSDAYNGESSGIFRYVRILWAGAPIAPGNELNSLTLGGVGAGTELHHVEAAYGADDAFEFFGGRVNAKYLLALAPNDDCFDFDHGYYGRLQFLVSVLKSGLPFSSDPNGIESDNEGTSPYTHTPRTRPVISNMTVIGFTTRNTSLLNAARFRRNSDLNVRNSIFMGYPTGITFESAGSIASRVGFRYNLVHGFSSLIVGAATLPATNSGWLNASNANANIQLNNIVAGATFNPSPKTTSPAASGADFTGLPIGGITPTNQNFVQTTYRGAFPVNNRTWMNGWTYF